MKLLALTFLALSTLSVHAAPDRSGPRMRYLDQRTIALNKQWADCFKGRGDQRTYQICIRDAAVASAYFLEENLDFFESFLKGRPNPEPRLKRFHAIKTNYLDFRDSQCQFEELVNEGSPLTAWTQKGRCHYRTALDFAYLMTDLLFIDRVEEDGQKAPTKPGSDKK